jgi:hypothetical protein
MGTTPYQSEAACYYLAGCPLQNPLACSDDSFKWQPKDIQNAWIPRLPKWHPKWRPKDVTTRLKNVDSTLDLPFLKKNSFNDVKCSKLTKNHEFNRNGY